MWVQLGVENTLCVCVCVRACVSVHACKGCILIFKKDVALRIEKTFVTAHSIFLFDFLFMCNQI